MNSTEKLAKTLGVSTVKDNINSIIRDYYSTGCKPLDVLLGGGLPSGRLIELYGKPSEGKSTIALEFSKSFTNYWKDKDEEYFVLWIESESVFDRMRAKYIGCDIDRFLISESPTVEDGFEIIEKTILAAQAGKFKLLIIWDTIAATITNAQKSTGGAFAGGMAEKPRIIFQSLRKITGLMGEVDVTTILVNQVYSSIGGVGGYESPGGFGIKFFSSIRISVRMVEKIFSDDGQTMVAINSELETVKNKITLPRQKIKVYIAGERGFNNMNTLYNYCIDNKIIVLKGSWKYIEIDTPNLKIEESFQNQDKLREKIKQNPLILEYLEYKVVDSRSKLSPFMKVRLIETLWQYEIKFYGEPITSLGEEEVELAKLEEIEILKQDSPDDLVAIKPEVEE